MEGVPCHIGQVGKTLVHYKLLKDNVVRPSNSLGNQAVLAKHLRAKQAVLVPSLAEVVVNTHPSRLRCR